MGQTPRLVAPLNKRRRCVAVREALEDVERHGLHVLSHEDVLAPPLKRLRGRPVEPPPSGSIQNGLVPPHIKGLVPPDVHGRARRAINSDVEHPRQNGPREAPVPPHPIPLREYVEADAPVHS